MQFNDIKPVRKKAAYLDAALSRMKKVSLTRERTENERRRISSLQNAFNDNLQKVTKGFPSVEALHPFYRELLDATIGIDAYKQDLARLQGMRRTIRRIGREHLEKLRRKEPATYRQFLARIDSVLRDDVLARLEAARKTMRTFPDIKEHLYTVCIAGFPNVGKTTLFNSLTGGRAEINAYAFTTKSLNVGYIAKDYYTVQVVDTPGTLDRIERMNNIEKQAALALRHFASLIIYVYDLTEAYPLDEQIALDEHLRKDYADVPIYYYFSKQDLLKGEKVAAFCRAHGIARTLADRTALKEELLAEAVSRRSLR